eukprot:SAG31_NODE_1670_length_7567_cov_13.084360_6_plen_200_part_00
MLKQQKQPAGEAAGDRQASTVVNRVAIVAPRSQVSLSQAQGGRRVRNRAAALRAAMPLRADPFEEKMWRLQCSQEAASNVRPEANARSPQLRQLGGSERNNARRQKLVSWLEDEITRRLRLTPAFATAEYFELVVENSAPEPRVMQIRIPTHEAGTVKLVTDPAEQAAFRAVDPFLLSQATGKVNGDNQTFRLEPVSAL